MTSFPDFSDSALKEWAVAVRALASGSQISVFRKGGIHRSDKQFTILRPQFLLYPTYEHQRPNFIKDSYTYRDELYGNNHKPNQITLAYWCRVTAKLQVSDQETLNLLSYHHLWTDDYLGKRLGWRPSQPMTIVILRVYELQRPQVVPILPEYQGCKSWVELGRDIPLGKLTPVLSDVAFDIRERAIRGIVDIA